MNCRRPDPRIVLLSQQSQPDSVFREQLNGLVASSHRNKLAIREIRQRQRIETQRPILAHNLAAQRIERDRLTPVNHTDTVRRYTSIGRRRPIRHSWIAGHAVDGAAGATRSFDASLLFASFISHGHDSVVQSQDQVLSVVGPAAAIDASWHFGLLHGLLVGRPESKVRRAARRQLVGDRIEGQALDAVVVTENNTLIKSK